MLGSIQVIIGIIVVYIIVGSLFFKACDVLLDWYYKQTTKGREK